MRLLLTWSDRSGRDDSPHAASRGRRDAARGAPRGREDRGPVLRLLDQPESREAYDAAWVLTLAASEDATESLVAAMRKRIPEVATRIVPIEDPSDHEQLFVALGPIVASIPEGTEITILLSAGTPQAQTLWVILVKAGLVPARMLQVVPPAFVPHPHPRAIREVTLDIEGFPEIRALREEVVQLRARERARFGLVGESAPMQALGERIARVATSRIPVLVLGETGSGKEVVARAIHDASDRASGPFLAENCGSLAEGTLASELFGHERGAFTGAVARKRGLFELAHGGTLFLDELGEMGPRIQVGLLRVLEEGVLRRVGGEESVRVDVRVVAATHRDLAAMVRDGTFREDLYYRLKGAVIRVPPLRERVADLEALVMHFLDATGPARPMPTREAWRALQRYPWPGNVRELRAEVVRWTVFADERVELDDLSPEIALRAGDAGDAGGAGTSVAPRSTPARAHVARPATHERTTIVLGERSLAEIVGDVETAAIDAALARHQGNLAQSARALGIDRNTLKRKLRPRT